MHCLLYSCRCALQARSGREVSCRAKTLLGVRRRLGSQGLPALDLDEAQFAAVLAAVGDTAAFGSMVAGELAASSREAAADLLASAGFLGRVLSLLEVRAHDIMTCDMHQVCTLAMRFEACRVCWRCGYAVSCGGTIGFLLNTGCPLHVLY